MHSFDRPVFCDIVRYMPYIVRLQSDLLVSNGADQGTWTVQIQDRNPNFTRGVFTYIFFSLTTFMRQSFSNSNPIRHSARRKDERNLLLSHRRVFNHADGTWELCLTTNMNTCTGKLSAATLVQNKARHQEMKPDVKDPSETMAPFMLVVCQEGSDNFCFVTAAPVVHTDHSLVEPIREERL